MQSERRSDPQVNTSVPIPATETLSPTEQQRPGTLLGEERREAVGPEVRGPRQSPGGQDQDQGKDNASGARATRTENGEGGVEVISHYFEESDLYGLLENELPIQRCASRAIFRRSFFMFVFFFIYLRLIIQRRV
jgi:hypothetical protein